MRALRGTAREEVPEAQTRVARAERAYERRIDDLEPNPARLERPGRGGLEAELGELYLYKHVLLFKGKENLTGHRLR